ncbi:MAG: PIN domain-containing protein [Acidobacteria bacterium]|nr:PIN domain-containing protein [Acidobacteriota bacterium]
MGEVLIDTNVLVYAHQPAEAAKYARAVRAVGVLIESGRARVSAQVLGEFVSAMTRGRRPILGTEDALAQAERLADAMPVLDVTRPIVLEAVRGVRQHRLSYYDAQIWATARLNQIAAIFTEDFQDGRRLESVQFVNPLRAGFDVDRWI